MFTNVSTIKKKNEKDFDYDKLTKKNYITSDNICNAASKKMWNWILWQYAIDKWNSTNDKINVRKFILIALSHLIEDKLIRQYNINFNGKTFKQYEIIDKINYYATVDINYEAFTITQLKNQNPILFGGHYSLSYDMIKKNNRNHIDFSIEIESQSIKDQLSTFIKIDSDLLNSSIREIRKINKITNTNNTSSEEYSKIRKMLEKFTYENDIKAIIKTHQKLSRLQNLIKLETIHEYVNKANNQEMFIPFSYCFRGRVYYNSILSPTDCKELRYCMYQGVYEENIEDCEKEHIFNDIIKKVLKESHESIEVLDKKIKNLKSICKDSIIWQLVSIGETNKSKLGSKVHISKFIEEGIEVFNNNVWKPENNDDIEKYAKITLHKKIIKDIIKGEKIKKWLVYKDATASSFQHLIRVLGSNDENSLIWCNLKSKDTWYDPYAYIIKKTMIFLYETLNISQIEIEKLDKIFIRKHLKKTLMTDNYGAGFQTCWQNFSNDIFINQHNADFQKIIEVVFRGFYYKIHKDSLFTELAPSAIKDKIIIKGGSRITFYNLKDNSESDINYYKQKNLQKEYITKKKRLTYQSKELVNEIDSSKLKRSSIANYIHCQDAAIVRWYFEQGNKKYTIHDCFSIDCMNVTYLISTINDAMRFTFHDLGINKKKDEIENIFSIFIII